MSIKKFKQFVNESNEERGYREWKYDVKTGKATMTGEKGVMYEVGIDGFWDSDVVDGFLFGRFELESHEEEVAAEGKQRLETIEKQRLAKIERDKLGKK